jgi:hypothetical protein
MLLEFSLIDSFFFLNNHQIATFNFSRCDKKVRKKMSAAPASYERSVVPRSEAWKKLNNDVLLAEKALNDFRAAHGPPETLRTHDTIKEYFTVANAHHMAVKLRDRQEEADLLNFRAYHIEYMRKRLVEIKAEPRYMDEFMKRIEIGHTRGSMPDISDSKRSFDLAWEFASEIYRMFPNFIFIKSVKDDGVHMLYDTKMGGYPFDICFSFSYDFDSQACDELKHYINFLYFQIQAKERPPKL